VSDYRGKINHQAKLKVIWGPFCFGAALQRAKNFSNAKMSCKLYYNIQLKKFHKVEFNSECDETTAIGFIMQYIFFK